MFRPRAMPALLLAVAALLLTACQPREETSPGEGSPDDVRQGTTEEASEPVGYLLESAETVTIAYDDESNTCSVDKEVAVIEVVGNGTEPGRRYEVAWTVVGVPEGASAAIDKWGGNGRFFWDELIGDDELRSGFARGAGNFCYRVIVDDGEREPCIVDPEVCIKTSGGGCADTLKAATDSVRPGDKGWCAAQKLEEASSAEDLPARTG